MFNNTAFICKLKSLPRLMLPYRDYLFIFLFWGVVMEEVEFKGGWAWLEVEFENLILKLDLFKKCLPQFCIAVQPSHWLVPNLYRKNICVSHFWSQQISWFLIFWGHPFSSPSLSFLQLSLTCPLNLAF